MIIKDAKWFVHDTWYYRQIIVLLRELFILKLVKSGYLHTCRIVFAMDHND